MKILVINSSPSWGESVELVQKNAGLTSSRSMAETPDVMPLTNVGR
jgi:hypothetical protein